MHCLNRHLYNFVEALAVCDAVKACSTIPISLESALQRKGQIEGLFPTIDFSKERNSK